MHPNPGTLANNIRMLRKGRHWSQEELARVSDVDVRTVQRAEAGRPLEVETLKAIAAAFDTTIEFLQISPDEIVAAVDQFRKDHKIIEMHVPTRTSDLGSLIAGADAYLLERIGELTESQLDQIAEFEATLHDYVDIWRDLQATDRREVEKNLFDYLASLTTSGVKLSFGTEKMAVQFGTGQPMRMCVLYVAAAHGAEPILAMVRPKDMPFTFA